MNAIDVAIVGLGPTGLTLAHMLGIRGLRVEVLERDHEFYGRARAVYTDDECLRVLQAAGIADELAADMNQDCPAQWLRGDGALLSQFTQFERPNGWPISNFLYQPVFETKMEEMLARYPHVTTRRGREVTGFVQDADGVTVSHRPTVGGNEETTRARYMIAADGGRSQTRKTLGIEMTGGSYPERWLVVDLKVTEPNETLRHLPYFSFVCDPAQPVVCCPQPGGHHRFEFQLSHGQDAAEMERPEKIQSLLSTFIDPNKAEILRSLVYTFNALNAERWRDKRVLLAGDAAHMTPQFMGQGMSAGIRDAGNLAWKLDLVLRGKAGDKLLDSYTAERKPHAQAMIDVSVFMMKFVSVRNPLLARIRNAMVWSGNYTPGLAGWIKRGEFKPKPVMENEGFAGLPRRGNRAEGWLIPQPRVRDFNGRSQLLDNFLSENFTLLGIGCDPLDSLDANARAKLEYLGMRSVSLWPSGGRPQARRSIPQKHAETVEIEDITGEFFAWLKPRRVRKNTVLVLRPDRFIAGAVAPKDINNAVEKLLDIWVVKQSRPTGAAA